MAWCTIKELLQIYPDLGISEDAIRKQVKSARCAFKSMIVQDDLHPSQFKYLLEVTDPDKVRELEKWRFYEQECQSVTHNTKEKLPPFRSIRVRMAGEDRPFLTRKKNRRCFFKYILDSFPVVQVGMTPLSLADQDGTTALSLPVQVGMTALFPAEPSAGIPEFLWCTVREFSEILKITHRLDLAKSTIRGLISSDTFLLTFPFETRPIFSEKGRVIRYEIKVTDPFMIRGIMRLPAYKRRIKNNPPGPILRIAVPSQVFEKLDSMARSDGKSVPQVFTRLWEYFKRQML